MGRETTGVAGDDARKNETGERTYPLEKFFCLAEFSLAVHGDWSWSVGEIVGLLLVISTPLPIVQYHNS